MPAPQAQLAAPCELRVEIRSTAELSAETLPNPAVVLIAGAVAGIASRTATAPLDRLKTLMQVGPPMGVRRPMALDGVRNGLREILRAGGPASFWQGNGANCIKVMPESAIRFWTYDAVKVRVCRDPRCPSLQERLFAGAAAGFASCLAIYPMEVTKTRMAVAKQGQFDSIAACVRATVKHEGPSALYKGLAASLVGIVPFSAVDLALYSTLKERCIRSRGGGELPVLSLLGCGAASSAVAQVITYPLALAKTRMQVAGMGGRSPRVRIEYGLAPAVRPEYTGLLDCLRQTVRGEGLRGLYAALSESRPVGPASAAQAADWPRLAGARGSLELGVALKEASGAPAGRSLSRLVLHMGKHSKNSLASSLSGTNCMSTVAVNETKPRMASSRTW